MSRTGGEERERGISKKGLKGGPASQILVERLLCRARFSKITWKLSQLSLSVSTLAVSFCLHAGYLYH